MSGVIYRNYRVRYLSTNQETPASVRDSTNPTLWVCEDIIPAVSEEAATAQLISKGYLPVRAKYVTPRTAAIPSDYASKFLMALLFSVQGGASAAAAMAAVIESEQWPLRGHLDPALRLLRAGATFSEALTILGMYDETTLSILAAGEHTGMMQQSLTAAVAHLQRKNTAEGLMKGAVVAIMFDVGLAITSCLSAVLVLLPQAEKQSGQMHDPAVLANFQSAVQFGYLSNWLLILFALVGLVLAGLGYFGYMHGTPSLRKSVETALRGLPLFGKALVHDAVSASTNIASSLLRGGVLLTNALDITVRTCKLPTVREYWHTAQELILGGIPSGSALARAPLSVAEQRVVASHTNFTQLAEAFRQISDARTEQASSAYKRFIFLGLVASFLYSGLGIASIMYVNYIQITSLMSAANGSM